MMTNADTWCVCVTSPVQWVCVCGMRYGGHQEGSSLIPPLQAIIFKLNCFSYWKKVLHFPGGWRRFESEWWPVITRRVRLTAYHCGKWGDCKPTPHCAIVETEHEDTTCSQSSPEEPMLSLDCWVVKQNSWQFDRKLSFLHIWMRLIN